MKRDHLVYWLSAVISGMFLMIVFLFLRINAISSEIARLDTFTDRQIEINKTVSRFIEIVARQ